MSLVQIPPLQAVQGQASFFNAVFMEGNAPVDLSVWTGEIKLAHDVSCREFWSAPVDLDAQGNVSVTIPAEELDAFCIRSREIGLQSVGVFQITLTAPVPEFNEVWQGIVAVAGVVQ